MKKPLLLLLIVCLFETGYSYAQPLSGLDPTFANNGIYVGDTGIYGSAVVQTDGKILVTGREMRNGVNENVKRFNQDGTVDVSFGNGGFFTMPFPNGNPGGFNSIALQPDGKIILGGGGDTGTTNIDFLLARLQPDGTYDSSFGGGGYVMTSYIHPYSPAVREYLSSIIVQPDGKILAYGYSDFLVDTLHVVRYHSDGMVDSSFGVNGRVKIADGFTYPTANDVAIMPDGRIVLGAETKIDALGGAAAFTAIRLLPNGELDTSFNHTGIAYTNNNLPGLLYSKAMCLQPDGKVLLAGYADSLTLIRFDTSGQLDVGFGVGGVAKIAGGSNIRNAVAYLQPDGKIYISGQIDAANYLYRLHTDGRRDSSFGLNGELIFYGFSIGSITTQDAHILTAGMLTRKTALARLASDATNVSDLYRSSPVSIYPNPAADYIHIYSSTLHKLSQISLYAPDGKLLRSQLHPDIDRLSTEGLADGFYYLHIRFADHTTLVRKVIIQKN